MSEKKRVSIVTGGLSGIGQAITQRFAERGDIVIVLDRTSPQEVSGAFHYLQVDVSSIHSIRQGFAQVSAVLKQHAAKLHALVNCAGITRDNLALRTTEEEYGAVLEVNLKGTFFCSQEALKVMVGQRAGYLVNISSIVGIYGNPGQANYAASKGGVIALTKTLAQEYASRGIVVNAIAPGFIETPMTEKVSPEHKQKTLERIALRRFGTPDDVAALAAFLTSGHADYITGQVIGIDGGLR